MKLVRLKRGGQYRCKHCGKTVERAQEQAWVKSWCERTQRYVHLMRVPDRVAAP